METTQPAKMRAVVGHRYGGPEVLVVEEIDTPLPGQGQVLVKVEASSLNALDWHMRTGTPYLVRFMAGLRGPKRLVDGADVAGTVVAIGGGVSELAVGDTVFGECNGGGFAEYVVARQDRLVAIPTGVSFESGGATGVAAMTALQGLRTHAKVQPGEHVLINGAAGGVGTFAVQIAKALGAQVTAVCSQRNVAMVGALGADQVVDYQRNDVVTDSLTAGVRFDVIFDGVGNRTAKECLSILQPDGRLVVVGGPKGNPWLDPIPHMARTALRFLRATQSVHHFVASTNQDDLRFLGELLDDGKLIPQVQRVIGLAGVPAALAEIGTGHVQAKIVVVPQR